MKLTNPMKVAGFAAALSLFGWNAQANETITLKMADQFPLTHVASKLGMQTFKKTIEEKSEGRINIRMFPAEQISKAAGLFDAVRNRVVDIAVVGVVYVTDKVPLTSAAELPGLFTDSVKGSAAFDAYIKTELLEREYLSNNVRPLWGFITPPYQLMLRKGDSLGDIKDIDNLKLRTAGATGEMIAKSLGAVPVKVPAADLYLALQRGTVDGAIYNPPSTFAYKIDEVLASVSTNASLGAVAFATLINEDVWQGLPDDVKTQLMTVADELRTSMSSQFQTFNDQSYPKLEKAGVKPFALSGAVLGQFEERLQTVAREWVSQMEARNLPGQDMLDAFKAHLAKQ
ncbi:TRAP transporter substrate-binding protein [Sneathiella chinensis]|uniref:C4-dicarboxylate ABC transporter n=1 Tax=Sneathiella chinensis TaxID=349750 RepID=A0ABQ5TZU1_9PROT|nr:TRAP transporter substrate-binding protein DctP [Sneathiella chinensis]GLQ05129.1 C4-dicarboxylate ABC transporter [Sneathiella chinensis]